MSNKSTVVVGKQTKKKNAYVRDYNNSNITIIREKFVFTRCPTIFFIFY